MDDGESSRAERLVHLQLRVLAAGSPLGLTMDLKINCGPNGALSGVVIGLPKCGLLVVHDIQ